jgi:hypothetical protein
MTVRASPWGQIVAYIRSWEGELCEFCFPDGWLSGRSEWPSSRDKFENLDVEEVFKNYQKHIHPKIMSLRQLILDTANKSKDVGVLEESLRWGSPVILRKMEAPSAWIGRSQDQIITPHIFIAKPDWSTPSKSFTAIR